jgi:hypothetical protein
MSTAAASIPGTGRWLTLLGLTLLGYALFGKGWAYLGVPPLFIGEAILACGVLAFLWFGRWRGILDIPVSWSLLLLLAWGLCRTWPDISRYGVPALRDAVIWGYGVFALLVCGFILAEPARLAALLHRYRQFVRLFLICIPFIWIVTRVFPRPIIPHWPWVDVPIIQSKGGDVQVHAAGILAFWVAGLGGPITLRRVLLLAACVGLAGTYDRAGLLSFLAVFAVCFVHQPQDCSLWRLIAIGVCGVVLLAATNIRVKMPEREREISFDQLVANLSSLAGTSRAGDLDDTKQWRLEWWGDIIKYTVDGKYCWTGKGFGINLADDDGYQVQEDDSLRSPHNGHLTMLARGGVPGLVLWALVQLHWACSLLGGYVRSRRAGERRWTGLFLFLLAYWLAFMINTAFDVFLEGPMGGIWFWTIYGIGMAALWTYKHHPAVLGETDHESGNLHHDQLGRWSSVGFARG